MRKGGRVRSQMLRQGRVPKAQSGCRCLAWYRRSRLLRTAGSLRKESLVMSCGERIKSASSTHLRPVRRRAHRSLCIIRWSKRSEERARARPRGILVADETLRAQAHKRSLPGRAGRRRLPMECPVDGCGGRAKRSSRAPAQAQHFSAAQLASALFVICAGSAHLDVGALIGLP